MASLTAAGLDLPRHEDILAEIDDAFFADTGIQLDSANPDNAKQLLVRLNGYMADQLVSLAELLQTIYDATDPDTAQGVQATNLARIVGVRRKLATPSTATIRCSGTNGTVIREGAVVEGGTSDPLARWRASADGVISGGYVDLIFEADVAGATTALADTIDTIVTPILGWASATNLAAAAVGTDEETDEDLLARRRLSLATRAGCGIPGIRSRLLALEYVQTVALLSNGEDEERIVQGITMPPCSYLVVILPDQLTAEQEEGVLSVLYDSSLATSTAAGTDVDGTVVDGVEWPVAFDYGVELAITIAYTITTVTGANDTDARAALKTAVAALWPLGLAETLTQLRLLALAYDTGLVATAEVLIQGVDADFDPAFVERISSATLTVNGVTA